MVAAACGRLGFDVVTDVVDGSSAVIDVDSGAVGSQTCQDLGSAALVCSSFEAGVTDGWMRSTGVLDWEHTIVHRGTSALHAAVSSQTEHSEVFFDRPVTE